MSKELNSDNLDLERRVEEYYSKAIKFPENKKIYTHSKRIYNDYDWEVEEIRRCTEGFDGMCGKMYFYFNYCYIIDNKRGKILPDFRVADNEWFKLMESFRGDNSGYGVVCVKRRRGGFSWKEAADVMHDCLFTPFFNVGMNSKTERDSIALFKKCKFIYDNLPSFLRVAVDGGKTKLSMLFAQKDNDENGNPILTGNMSEIICVPPTDSAYEGLMLGKWVCDEAGKIGNLIQMWSFTEDCLSSGGTERVGIPVIFGTSGEVDKNGAGLRELWYKAEMYKLKQFFFAGYMGLIVDKYGNDDVKGGIRHILKERERLARLSQKQYNDYLQKYPLTPEEAFMQLTGAGVGDAIKINHQIVELEKNPSEPIRGYFRWGRDGEPSSVFVPDNNGMALVYERPRPHLNLYIAACLTPGEKVLTDSGYMNIEDISFENKLVNENGKYVDIKRLIRIDKKDEETFKFKMAGSYRTTNFTSEHPILVSKPNQKINHKKHHPKYRMQETYNDFSFKYTEAKDVCVGDWTKIPNMYLKENNNISSMWKDYNTRIDRRIENPLNKEDFWWFIGLWLGDGWSSIDKNKVQISINKKEIVTINKLKSIIVDIFKRSPEIIDGGSSCTISFSNSQLNNFLSNTFGNGAENKFIPEWVKFIPHNFKRNLVIGYLDSDGCIYYSKERNYYTAEYVSISLDLLEGIQDIFYSIGIISNINLLRKDSSHVINGRLCNTKDTYHLRISNNYVLKLAKDCDGIISEKLKKIDTSLGQNKKAVAKRDIYFSDDNKFIYIKIKSIEKSIYTGIVYNFECETNTFLCRSITTHNCDPADHDETSEDASSMAMYIFMKQNGLDGRRIVFEYVDRPKLSAKYYEQALLALIYYNNCKVLIENNRYRMISSIQEWGFGSLLQPSPRTIGRIFQSGPSTFGLRMNDAVKRYMEDLISEYIDDSVDLIPSMELLKEFLNYGSINTDRVMAFGICLIFEKEDRTVATTADKVKKITPSFKYRNIGGKIVRTKE